ncbi:related to E2 ubiquitin-conjugating enzyme [Sporisorium reilianum f. sp. reilianum]|uniref:Related to E2 ubiquitin-conjugating enzyme n=1 Tax=Sporisorium reilianum f. sp. reilianum TaxID=72559 RepID=A0A2N8UMV6_9BASI|nr:related to E2 ubiquitin-conjugating enzyme [Sporisorium reilianum f. sp. reilianum]
MVSPTTIKSLLRELTHLAQHPTDDIRVSLSDTDILSFSGWIRGPSGTPYAGGFFRITFDFTDVDFPSSPPLCRFATPIFHPNVSRAGDICVSSLKKDWKREYGVERILMTVRCLLIEPNADSALDAEASRLMQEDWESYAETARLWTSVHAAKRPECFEEASKPTAAPQQSMPMPCSPSASAPATQHMLASTLKPNRPAAATSAPKRGLRRL